MQFLLLTLIIVALVAGPQLWIKRVIRRYSRPEDRYEATGAQTARRLLDAHGLQAVAVESTDAGDHYDPAARVVRLSADNYHGRSLTATAIAAHEVGHALQDAEAYPPLRWRTRLVRLVAPLEKLGAALMMGIPLIVGLTRLPYTGLLMFVGGFLTLGAAVAVHLLTLPTEFDASFGRAMPVMEKHGVLYRSDAPHARRLLRAAAMTYVAASLMSLLNIARWWAILRR
jgi:hypothetical protein